MQKIIISLMLSLLSITGTLCAQENNKSVETGADQLFELPPNSFQRRFWVDLGAGNRLRIDLGKLNDLDRLNNVDSILMVFLSDMRLLKDSLGDPLSSRRIDYVVGSAGNKKVRIRRSAPSGSSFLIEGGESTLLKLEQDTINIVYMWSLPGKETSPTGRTPLHYDRLTFFINQFSELERYITGGLNNKLSLLRQKTAYNSDWTTNKEGRLIMKADPAVSADRNKGYFTPFNDHLRLDIYGNIQNYKNVFAPSFSMGASLHFVRTRLTHNLSLNWEPLFLFATNTQGHLQAYRNDFLVFGYSFGLTSPGEQGDAARSALFNPSFSLGYLLTQQGDVMDKHTFRFTAGGLRLYQGNLQLEPCMYFHDFFRGVTPGVRLSLRFL